MAGFPIQTKAPLYAALLQMHAERVLRAGGPGYVNKDSSAGTRIEAIGWQNEISGSLRAGPKRPSSSYVSRETLMLAPWSDVTESYES